MSMSNFPNFRDHWALYRWWEPVIVSHAVRCHDFKEAKQQAFVVLAEAAGRYNGTGPFVNYFSLNLMSIRGETRDRAQNPEVSLEVLAEADDNWELLLEDDGPSLDVDDPLFEMQNFLTGYTVDFDELPGDGDLDHPDPQYIFPPTMEELPGEPYATTEEDGDLLLEDSRPPRESHFDEDFEDAADFVIGLGGQQAEVGHYRARTASQFLAGHDQQGRPVRKPRYRVYGSRGQYLGLTFRTPTVGLWQYEPICQAWGEVYAPACPPTQREHPDLLPDEDEDPADIETVEREAGLMRPSSAKVQRDLEVFLSRLDPYQRAFVKATLSGSGPQACKEAALAAIKQAQLNRRKANVYKNAIAALARGDLHAACQQWNLMPQLEAV